MGSAVLLAAGLSAGLVACSQQKVEESPAAKYTRPLAPGESALRPTAAPPELADAFRQRDAMLLDAIDESLVWFQAPSSRQFFPFEHVSHEQAEASLLAMKQLLTESPSEAAFVADVERIFEVYESVGYDGSGTVLFTGYYSPVFDASRVRTERFTAPLYTRPDDLVTEPVSGQPLGRRLVDGSVVPYFSRQEIESTELFAGRELVWLEDDLSAYIVHVNGSAKLRMPDGEVVYVGYGGKTDRPYGSLGKALIDAGHLRKDELSLAAIKRLYRRKPQAVRAAMMTNENYVFFTEYAGDSWPAGSLGVPVTTERSLATDKRIYPRGGLVLVDTDTMTYSGGSHSFLQFMLDQDTGGAIEAPGRADIFMGIGPAAEILAGGQFAEGKLYYFFLRPEYVADYAPAAQWAKKSH
jgi:membrane-bound lytic murein transglycosylase A